MEYAGADWINKSLLHGENVIISDLGRDVADLLGEVFKGIYHLDFRALHRVNWADDYVICFVLSYTPLATYDFNLLTMLVFLCHHMAIRLEIYPVAPGRLEMQFHRRNRTGDQYHRHPRLQEAVDLFNKFVSIPETDPLPVNEIEDNFIHNKYGYCYYEIEQDKTPLIFNLYVYPQYRKQGHARKILEFVMNEIRQTGYTGMINIEVSPREDSISRESLAGFYSSLGLNLINCGQDGKNE